MKNAATWKVAGAIIILLATLAVYAPAMRGGFIWDDDAYVAKNPTLRDLHGLEKIWFQVHSTPQYYPMVFTSFWAEKQFWGVDPFNYHLVNILLHALNALLLWQVLRRLKVPGAWWAAAIFALHPVHVESVAWISERKNVLSCTFYISAILAYLRFEPLEEEDSFSERHWKFYPLAVFLFLGALLSKTVTASLPAAILLLLWWKRGCIRWRDVAPLIPMFVMGIVLGQITAWTERSFVGAEGETWNLSAIERVLIAGRAFWFYAGKLIWPNPLIFNYPRWHIDAGAWWQYLFPLSAVAVMVVLWLARKRIGRGPLVAVLFFAGTLVPALGFFNVYPMLFSFVADHFQYHASMGLIVLGTAMATTVVHRFYETWRMFVVVLGVALLLVLGAFVWRQSEHYEGLETLWRDTIAKNPESWMAHNNLGDVLVREGKTQEGFFHFEEAYRLKPDSPATLCNMGDISFESGDTDSAIQFYLKALDFNPRSSKVHNKLGRAFVTAGKLDEAIAQFNEAIHIVPDLTVAHYNLGLALMQQGKISKAAEQFSEVIRLVPDSPDAYYQLGLLLVHEGKTREAIEHYHEALRLKPDWVEALDNLAWLLATHEDPKFRDGKEAVRLAAKACELTANRDPLPLDTLAAAYAETGQFTEAVDNAQKAVDLYAADGNKEEAGEVRNRLALYRSGRSYHQVSSAE